MTKLIRKTQQPSDYPSNQIHDAYSTSTTDTYSCNYINEARLEEYSTTEKIIGKWIDGKPIYRKVVNVNVSSKTSNTIEITTSSLGIDTFINISGVVKDNSNLTMQLLSDTQAITVEPNNSRIIIYMNNNTAKSYSGHVIFEYTKTTD